MVYCGHRSVPAASCFFFFSSRSRHTSFTSDWSSDVCSSDLGPEAAHSPRPPARSCVLLGAAFASRPSETKVRDVQEQRQGATKSPSAARRRSWPEARSGQRRGREYLLLAGLRAERTWGVFSNTFSAMPIVLIDVQREGEEIWRDDERCRWWRGGARRAGRRRLGAGGFIKHHGYLPDRQRRHTTAAWS